MSSASASSTRGSSIQRASAPRSIAALAAARSSISGSSSMASPAKLCTRRQRSSRRACSGACSRAATTARHAGRVAAIRARSLVSIGIPWSRAIVRNAAACFCGVKPRST
jgi:hypothetical protein